MNQFEINLEQQYCFEGLFAGTDEAGRGALAGPLVVASVILPKNYYNPLIRDSKKLSRIMRQFLFNEIKEHAVSYSIEILSVKDVEYLNPKKASIKGMEESLKKLKIIPQWVITDAEKIETFCPQVNLIQGDNLSQTVAAASILAKEYRDKIMENLHLFFPYYDWYNNKGYGTKKHQFQLEKYGSCYFHRKTYAPVFKTIAKNKELIK